MPTCLQEYNEGDNKPCFRLCEEPFDYAQDKLHEVAISKFLDYSMFEIAAFRLRRPNDLTKG